MPLGFELRGLAIDRSPHSWCDRHGHLAFLAARKKSQFSQLAFRNARCPEVMVYKFAQKVDRSSRDALVTIFIETGLIIATLQTLPAFGKAPSG